MQIVVFEMYYQIGIYNTIISSQRLSRYYFLVAEQESNQRSQHRGGADREVYRHFFNKPPLLPRLRAALPYVPLPAPVEGFLVVGIKVLGLTIKSTSTRLSTRAGRGSGEGAAERSESCNNNDCRGQSYHCKLAQSRAENPGQNRSSERLCGQRLPRTLSLVRFLCGHKK